MTAARSVASARQRSGAATALRSKAMAQYAEVRGSHGASLLRQWLSMQRSGAATALGSKAMAQLCSCLSGACSCTTCNSAVLSGTFFETRQFPEPSHPESRPGEASGRLAAAVVALRGKKPAFRTGSGPWAQKSSYLKLLERVEVRLRKHRHLVAVVVGHVADGRERRRVDREARRQRRRAPF